MSWRYITMWLALCSVANAQGVGSVGAPAVTNFGGYTASANATLYTSTSAYAAGAVIGSVSAAGNSGLISLTGLVRATQSSGLVQKLLLSTADTQTPTFDVYFFNAVPSSSTITDKVAFSLATADIPKVMGIVHVTDCSSDGTPISCQAQQQAMPFVLPSAGGTLYMCIVTRAAFTTANGSDLTYVVSTLED